MTARRITNVEQEAKARLVLEAMAEYVATTKDIELMEDIIASGEDPAKIAVKTRSALLQGVLVYKKTKLKEAQRKHEIQVEDLNRKNYSLPESPSAMRVLLNRVLTMEPQYRDALLTNQFRDFSALSDEEVKQQLIQLAQLGVLDDPRFKDGKD